MYFFHQVHKNTLPQKDNPDHNFSIYYKFILELYRVPLNIRYSKLIILYRKHLRNRAVQMNIKWNSENIIFETLREAEVWTDSIGNEISGRVYDGYVTPDYKIAYVLLAEVPHFKVHTEIDVNNEP